ncbi:MAG TPA: SH3 domain-containing protein [Geminicoccaceae bacterium]|nr:SH3 domain-containing protein [Geminicoccaceae bacterium]
MRFARVLGSSMALLATGAAAAPGDALVVTGDVVNVRTGPGMDNPVLFQARRDQQVTELARTTDWIQVRIPDRAADGWIHQSLVRVVEQSEPAAPEPTPTARLETPGGPDAEQPPPLEGSSGLLQSTVGTTPSGSEDQALAVFRSNVEDLNARAVAVAGVELFTGAEPAGNGTVQVMVTEMWGFVPEAGQASYVNTLFGQWYLARGGAGPLRVQVVDPSGAVLSEKSGQTP